MKYSDIVVTVTKNWANDFTKIIERNVIVVENGFETDLYNIIGLELQNLNEKFIISHTGTLPYSRNPESLWIALRKLIDNNPFDFKNNIKILLPGIVDDKIIETIKKYKLDHFTEIPGCISHNKAIEIQCLSSILILPINLVGNFKGILTGKIYEYIASRKPILAIGPIDGEVSLILKETKSGQLFDYNDVEGIYNFILDKYKKFISKNILINDNNTNINKYSRKHMAYKYSKIIESYL